MSIGRTQQSTGEGESELTAGVICLVALQLVLLKFLLPSNDKNQREFDVPGQEVVIAREGT